MRELTTYEKEKWYDKWNRFEMDSSDGESYFFSYGNELGEAFDGALYCTDKESYGLEDWFVHAAQVQVLDMYYYQIMYYADAYGGYETVDSLGLPSLSILREQFPGVFEENGLPANPDSTAWRQAWDWAMDWREEHLDEHEVRLREQQLRAELARLEDEGGIVE
jgi:hypothetical protein